MRRRELLGAAAVGALGLAGCGGGAPQRPGGSPTTASGTFPARVRHKYGTTTVEQAPERVVVAGLREQDALLALGVVPVATTEWYGDHPGAIFPWATDALGGRPAPEIVSAYTDGVQVERIAAQRPDLIVAVYSALTEREYDLLSRIAPTVAPPPDLPDFGSSWQQETLLSGAAVGQPDKARRLVAETERLIADAAAEHPAFARREGAMISNFDGIFVYGPDDVRNRLMAELGFTYPPALADALPDRFGGELSDEQIDRLDVGTLVWFTGPDNTPEQTRDAYPGYRDLPVSRRGRDVFIADDDRVYEATSFVSVLSMPTLMEELVPRLAAAADDDPDTPTTETA